jgi:hypothetical protein
MLSFDARKSVPAESFRRMVKERPDEVRELGRALARPTKAAAVTATVTTETGDALELVLEKGEWKIDSSAVDLYSQDTPRHALLGFMRALERRRYDIVLRYIPDGHREGLDAAKLKTAWEGIEKDEMLLVLEGLKRALVSAVIEEAGERATMPYSKGTVQLVRERNAWKIEDFD